MAAPVCTIDASGISIPDYETIRQWLIGEFKGIYGSDIYLEPDSQDGQLIAIVAAAINDANAATAAAYYSRSPSQGQGEGLSSLVGVNGISRKVATYSTVDLRLIGEAGTVITNGLAQDDEAVTWALPASVTIPLAGEITVTATARTIGAVTAQINTITNILTPTRGWQSVTNPSSAVVGQPVEPDSALKARQAASTALPAQTVTSGLRGAILAVPGVTSCRVYENDDDVQDANGLPPHSIAVVVIGGDSTTIADLIYRKKGAGVATFGDTEVILQDFYGIPKAIRFFRAQQVPVSWKIAIRKLNGFTTAISGQIQEAVAAHTNTLQIGQPVRRTRAYPAALLQGNTTFEVMSIQCAPVADGGQFAESDVLIAYNQIAVGSADQVKVVPG